MNATLQMNQGERLTVLLLRYSTAIMFVVILVFFGLQNPNFLDPTNLSNIVKQASYVGIIAVGITFVLLTAGIDLSVGANMYLSSLAAAYLMRDFDMPVALALAGAVIVGGLFGAFNAFWIVRLKVSPFMVTLSTLIIGRGVGKVLTESVQLDYPQAMLDFGSSQLLGVPMPIIAFAIVVILATFVLTQTAFGRQVYAVGNDPEVARKAGINTDRVLLYVYVICGMTAALAGFTLIAQIGRIDASFGEEYEFQVIAAAVLGGASLFGGVGNAFGAVIGAILIQMVRNGLIFAEVNLYLQPMVQAGIIFLAVFFDSLRGQNLEKLKRRFIRSEA